MYSAESTNKQVCLFYGQHNLFYFADDHRGVPEDDLGSSRLSSADCHYNMLHPVRIARIRCPRFVPRVGLPRNHLLIGSLTAALRFSKGWVRKDPNLGLRTGCMLIKPNNLWILLIISSVFWTNIQNLALI